MIMCSMQFIHDHCSPGLLLYLSSLLFQYSHSKQKKKTENKPKKVILQIKILQKMLQAQSLFITVKLLLHNICEGSLIQLLCECKFILNYLLHLQDVHSSIYHQIGNIPSKNLTDCFVFSFKRKITHQITAQQFGYIYVQFESQKKK